MTVLPNFHQIIAQNSIMQEQGQRVQRFSLENHDSMAITQIFNRVSKMKPPSLMQVIVVLKKIIIIN